MKPLPITLDHLLREYQSAHDEADVAQRIYQVSRSSRNCSLWLDALRSAQSAQDALIESLASEAGHAEMPDRPHTTASGLSVQGCAP